VTERLAVIAVALLTLAALWVAPWGAINRETGARSAVILLPNRVVDFTGRTDPVDVPGQGATLWLSVAALLAIAGGGALGRGARYPVWLVGGLVLVVVTTWGVTQLTTAVRSAKLEAFQQEVGEAIDRARDTYDLDALAQVRDDAPAVGLDASLVAARAAGLNVRRLPYNDFGFALAAFLSWVAGGLAILFGLRMWTRLNRSIDRTLNTVAVPATSILLALMAAAVVVLVLQPTPLGREVTIDGSFMGLVGRLDTLWYAYLTLFSDSLGSLPGFAEALKFATPLIFTGLAVAFGFQAGLFNIGAPGQMVLGAIAAMLVGVYVPGPAVLVLPLAVISAAVGGGLWGALPGWLKARFGANEVITTILLNFVAASMLLFILSSNPTFAAPAVRIIVLLTGFLVVLAVLAFIAPLRRLAGRAPRISFAVVGVALLIGVVVVALPRPGDAPVVVNLPFKVPGSEPKSQPLSESARLAQLPALLGIDTEENPGTNVIVVNVSALLALLGAGAALLLLPRFAATRGWGRRLIGMVVVGGAVYGLTAPFGLAAVDVGIPPTRLNFSFVLALATAVFMYYFLWRTKWGYELRAVGVSPKAAEYGGASIARNTILAMTISGAFAGLTATHYVLGGALEEYALRQSLPTNDGFDGIAVALLGGNAPLGIVLSAFLFGVLKHGGSVLNITFPELTRDVVNMILALVVLFIAARGFLPERIANPLRRSPPPDDPDPPAEPESGGEPAAPPQREGS
jgi:simple sugar transport system permease protein